MTNKPSGRTVEHAAHLVRGTIHGSPSEVRRRIESLVCHTNQVTEGSLFIAISGTSVDGHHFVDEAFARGAIGAIVEDGRVLGQRPGVVVSSTREAMSILADAWYDHPSRELHVAGVTGTNGKSSVAWWLSHLLSLLGLPSFSVGTMGVFGQGWHRPGSLTTPDALTLHQTLREGVDRDFAASVMEVSSHALHQARVNQVQFDVALFTNLSHDHLDYHGSMEEYFACKKYLFELLSHSTSSIQAIVTNADNPYGREIAHEYGGVIQGECITYGLTPGAQLRADRIEHRAGGMSFVVLFQDEEHLVSVPFLGEHNVENLLAVIGGALAFGWPLGLIVDRVPALPQVPGRLERFMYGGISAYVDYAHTPDALERALRAVRIGTAGRVFVVFGCGGDRDAKKRPIMGAIAREGADVVIVTNDNPRTEDPERIVADIVATGERPDYLELDRAKAIHWALSQAQSGDSVLIAGKGHEDYQIIGSERKHFSDQEVVRDWLGR